MYMYIYMYTHMHNGILLSHKKNEILLFIKWMDPENIMLNKPQKEKLLYQVNVESKK